ncbi:MAG: ABC transporter permease [Gammaproteobacteria bacterium]|nr:ABC transporter permease [Gammaproteobacteria bacterium]
MQTIPLSNLALAFIPVVVVIVVIWRWQLDYKHSIYAVGRMLIQLLLIGYVLTYVFQTNSAYIVITALSLMLGVASWIALRTISVPLKNLYLSSITAIVLGGGGVLLLITQYVLVLSPWYSATMMIPLAGMIFANCMNSISLAGERLESEINSGKPYDKAKIIALRTALIPITNSLLAVGIVSLPGMMTGQILSGVSPLIAVRYQVMVMCMIFGSAGIASAVFLHLVKQDFYKR